MNNLNEMAAFRSSPELVAKLNSVSIRKRLKAGSLLLQPEGQIRSILIVARGSLKVSRMDDEGRELLLYYIRAGESCVMSVLGGLHHDTSKVKAEVEEDAEILFLPIEQLPWLIREYPEWLDYIFRLYHKRFEELLDVVNAIAFKRMDERLLVLLRKKQELVGKDSIAATHEQLANELGTARVVISRLLKQLEDSGKVELGRGWLRLL